MHAFFNPFTMGIHPQGRKILIGLLLLLLGMNNLVYFVLSTAPFVTIPLAGFSLLLFLFVLNFFRYPKRPAPDEPGTIFSPADGKIVAIERVKETEYLKEERLLISVFMSAWNVHINWYPVGGKVLYKQHNPGAFLVAFAPKSSALNENTSVVIQPDNQPAILVRQIAGAVARRIVTYPKAGDAAKQGQEMGFIKFGSRLDVFLPLSAQTEVELGQKVYGNVTALAHYGQINEH